MKKDFFVDSSTLNMRLDRWIKTKILRIPQSLIEKNLRKGKIKINERKNKSSYKLKLNDKITFYNLEFKASENKKNKNHYIPSKDELVFSSSIFIENNENFVVINKPSGISVQSGTKSKKNIIDILRKTPEFENSSPYPVHRIDKETTGVLIVAKNREFAQLFTTLFRIRKIHKTYLGIVLGSLERKKDKFVDNLFYYEGKKKIILKAITNYSVLDSNNKYSLLKLNPETGRKHQLRKQLLMHGHPILGDNKYKFIDKNFKKNQFLMLHASKINFSINGIKYSFTANLPAPFVNNLKEKNLKIS